MLYLHLYRQGSTTVRHAAQRPRSTSRYLSSHSSRTPASLTIRTRQPRSTVVYIGLPARSWIIIRCHLTQTDGPQASYPAFALRPSSPPLLHGGGAPSRNGRPTTPCSCSCSYLKKSTVTAACFIERQPWYEHSSPDSNAVTHSPVRPPIRNPGPSACRQSSPSYQHVSVSRRHVPITVTVTVPLPRRLQYVRRACWTSTLSALEKRTVTNKTNTPLPGHGTDPSSSVAATPPPVPASITVGNQLCQADAVCQSTGYRPCDWLLNSCRDPSLPSMSRLRPRHAKVSAHVATMGPCPAQRPQPSVKAHGTPRWIQPR